MSKLTLEIIGTRAAYQPILTECGLVAFRVLDACVRHDWHRLVL